MLPSLYNTVFKGIFLCFLFFALTSCTKWELEKLERSPDLRCEAFDSITSTINGTFLPAGRTIVQHGHCWARHANPTIENDRTLLGALPASGAFSSSVTLPTICGVYYFRAYAIDIEGQVYYSNLQQYLRGRDCWRYLGGIDYPGKQLTNPSVFVIGNKAYVLGGGNNELWMFDRSYFGWIQKKRFPGIARRNAIAFALQGKGYFGTGLDSTSTLILKDFWQYDPNSDTWTQLSDAPFQERLNMAAIAVGDTAYACLGHYFTPGGGFATDFRDLFAAFHLNGSSLGWVSGPNLSIGSEFFGPTACNVADEWLFVAGAGGITQTSELVSALFFPAQNQWMQLSKPSEKSKFKPVVFSSDKHAFVTLGGNVETWMLNVENKQWLRKADFPENGAGLGWSIGNEPYILNISTGKLWTYTE